MRGGQRKGGSTPPNSRKGGDLGQETVSPKLLLLAQAANATVTLESRQVAEETRDISASRCIDAAGTKLPQAQ